MASFEDLMTSEEFMKKLSQKTTKDEVIELFSQHEIEMTDEDYNGLVELITGAIQPEGEITEEDLDNISGGAWYKYKCSCGKKFASYYFANLHAVYYGAKKIFCSDGGFTFCTYNGWTHKVQEIKTLK